MTTIPETFWTRLDAALGTVTLPNLEKAIGLGDGTLRKGRAADSRPTLEIVLRIARYLAIEPQKLLGPDTPPELLPATPPAGPRVRLANLTPSHLNPRRTIDPDALAELAESIVQQGLLQNLVVRQDKDQPAIYWIVAGERRYRALKLLETAGRLPAELAEQGVPVHFTTLTDAEHIAMALVENLQRVDVNPMDEAESIANLHALDPKKWTTRAIAEKLGVTQRQVQLRIGLAEKLPPEAKEKLRSGEITVSQAKLLASVPKAVQGDLLEQAMEGISAEEMAQDATQDMFPAEFAWFDWQKPGLETFTDPNTNEVFLTDFDAAVAMQKMAVEKRKAELLAKGASFVEVTQWIDSHQFPEGGTGVVIVLSLHSGQATIYEGRKDARKASPEGAARQVTGSMAWEAACEYHKEFTAAGKELIAFLADQMTVGEALRLLAFQALAPWDVNFLADHRGLPDTHRCKNLAILSDLKDAKGDDTKRLLAAWQHLEATKDGAINNVIVDIVGHQLHISPDRPLSPVLASLATKLKYTIPPILLHTPKEKAAALRKIEQRLSGQTDLENAIEEAEAA
jgi:ParB family chromosome partitioning protein